MLELLADSATFAVGTVAAAGRYWSVFRWCVVMEVATGEPGPPDVGVAIPMGEEEEDEEKLKGPVLDTSGTEVLLCRVGGGVRPPWSQYPDEEAFEATEPRGLPVVIAEDRCGTTAALSLAGALGAFEYDCELARPP